MTKTIELVEREIKFLEKQIVKYEIHLLAFPQVNVENRLEEMKEDLQTIKKIKCELEAWDLVKTGIYEGTEITGKYHDKAIKINRRVYVEGTEQYKTFKKALEVKNE